MEARVYRTVEFVEDMSGLNGSLALNALASHLDRMEQRGQEASGEYFEVHFCTAGSEAMQSVRWPIPMPKREDNIVLGYN